METKQFTVAKSTVECYKIRVTDGFAWADITIDANERGGRICIASDYGNWQNYWGAAGSDFKAFLGKISEDYAASKFGAEQQIDVQATVVMWKKDLLECRRAEDYTGDEARQIYDALEEVKHESHYTFVQAVQSTDKVMDFINQVYGSPEICHEPNPHFARFWKELWPVLLAEFKKEATLQPG